MPSELDNITSPSHSYYNIVSCKQFEVHGCYVTDSSSCRPRVLLEHCIHKESSFRFICVDKLKEILKSLSRKCQPPWILECEERRVITSPTLGHESFDALLPLLWMQLRYVTSGHTAFCETYSNVRVSQFRTSVS
jgi:hypothetical protein